MGRQVAHFGLSGTSFALSYEHLLIEADQLLDDVKRELSRDFNKATATAVRLAAFLAGSNIAPPTSQARGRLAPWKEAKVQRLIDEGLETELSVDDLAKHVSLSPSYFCRAFKKTFGEPPHAYVVRKRIELAKKLMLTTSESLSQIAYACGLSDQSHLSKSFRQYTGTTPSAWRRTHLTGPQSGDSIEVNTESIVGLDDHLSQRDTLPGLQSRLP